MEKKTLGKIVRGLFLQVPEAPPAGVLPADLPPPIMREGPAEPGELVPEGPVPDVSVDLGKVAQAAGVGPEAQDLVCRVRELMRGLPAEAPVEMRRAIVEASLRAFGISVGKIVEAVHLHERALEQAAREEEQKTQQDIRGWGDRIDELLQEAEKLRLQVRAKQDARRGMDAACRRHQAELREVLGFFGPESAGNGGELPAKEAAPE